MTKTFISMDEAKRYFNIPSLELFQTDERVRSLICLKCGNRLGTHSGDFANCLVPRQGFFPKDKDSFTIELPAEQTFEIIRTME